MDFFSLLAAEQPLLLGNVWDAASAQLAEELGYRAIGTSSAAMAAMLGYGDGEEMSFEELLFLVGRIRACTSVPLTVDIESGYSETPKQIASNIIRLVELGVCGINIEDSQVTAGQRSLDSAEVFAAKLKQICDALTPCRRQLFINVRCDSFLLALEDAATETLKRAALYQQAGADGLFVPCLTDPGDIRTLVTATTLPLNLMCMPELPDFDALKQLGVKRISMGNFVHHALLGRLRELLADVRLEAAFTPLFR